MNRYEYCLGAAISGDPFVIFRTIIGAIGFLFIAFPVAAITERKK